MGAGTTLDVFETFKTYENSRKNETMSLQDYLLGCRDDESFRATAAERMLKAIGEPEVIDTSKDESLGRIFQNRTIKKYTPFEKMHGMEKVVERIVSFLRHASQQMEEGKQILYLLGPVGGGKSSIAEILKYLITQEPMYVLKAGDKLSPVLESPLGLFDTERFGDLFETKYNIPRALLRYPLSSWAQKRLDEDFKGDISKFSVEKVYPSLLRQIGVTKTEPGDENNQDISALVGKLDIRQLEEFSQNDPDAYCYSGALNRANQGVLEFVEMFKAPIKVLHPLLTATQEGSYVGTENMGAMPFQGIIIAHSNESEWKQFKGNKNNEAFLDRICTVKVPYCLRYDEETHVYDKLIKSSNLSDAPCAPETLPMLAKFVVLTRLHEHDNSTPYSKLLVYNGESMKGKDPKAKSMQEYQDAAGVDEGMTGISTRFAFKVLSETFNHDPEEIAADPVHLMYVLEEAIKREQFDKETEEKYLDFIKTQLAAKYAEFIGNEIQKAYLESYSGFGQNLFDRYVLYADAWIEEQDFKDPDTGQIYDRDTLEKELAKIEKPAGVSNVKDFRNEVVKFVLRARAQNGGENPDWKRYEKLREVIQKRMFSQVEDLLPVISFDAKRDSEMTKKHHEFVERMVKNKYTERQVQRLVEWYMRVSKAG